MKKKIFSPNDISYEKGVFKLKFKDLKEGKSLIKS
jgi:predicted DNA-binding antitoxin AbrB/MazE fold protein